jgi:membrane dipeptidase
MPRDHQVHEGCTRLGGWICGLDGNKTAQSTYFSQLSTHACGFYPRHQFIRITANARFLQLITAGLAEWRKTNTDPNAATLSDVANHIDHIRNLVGVDHIGVGSDFDGFTGAVRGLEDVSKYPDLLAELLRRGYSKEDVKKIAGLNLLRVMRGAERVAREIRARARPE